MKSLWLIIGVLGVVFVLYQSFENRIDVVQSPTPEVPYVDFDYYEPTVPKNVLVILLHGGSWQVGDKLQLKSVGKYLATHGLSVVNMNYRKAPAFIYDAPLLDIAAVINKVENNLSDYDLTDGYQLMLLGFSAGGHLAAHYCVTETEYNSRQVDVCVGLAGIYDLKRVFDGYDGPLLVDAVRVFLGATDPVVASPRYRVSTGEATRFLLFWGEDDTVVSRNQMDEFSAHLSSLGVTVSSKVISGKDHLSIFTSIPESDEIGKAIIEAI